MVRLLVATWRPAFGLRATSSVLKEGGMFARFALLFIEFFSNCAYAEPFACRPLFS